MQEVGFTWPSSVVITVSLEASDAQQTDILTRFKEFGLAHKQLLTTDEFVAIARAVIDGKRQQT